MNTFTFRSFSGAVLVIVPLIAAGSPALADIDISITSGAHWLSSDTLQPGWEQPALDDGDWDAARAPYPSPTPPGDLIPGTSALHMWHDPDATSDGTTGPVQAWFRLRFNLDLVAANSAVVAQALVNGDDDYEFYVNGSLVFENHDGGFGSQVDTIDFGEYLRHGDNLLAVHAVDGSWDNPRNRGAERVLFDATVTSVPRAAVVVRTGPGWLSSDTYEPGWQNPDFDDGAWPVARAPYPSDTTPQALIGDTLAQFVWHDPQGTSDGTSGPDVVFLRYEFDLNVDPDTVPVVGQARVNADDDYDLYVNGLLVHENHDGGYSSVVDSIDFTYALREGRNVIAVHAADGEWAFPWNRGGERVLVDGLVATGVLEWNFESLMVYGDFWNCIGDPVIEGDEVLVLTRIEGCFDSPYLDEAVPGLHRFDVEEGSGMTLYRSGDVLPDGTGVLEFADFVSKPAQESGTPVFHAYGTDSPPTEIIQHGIYFDDGMGLSAAATTSTAIPGGTDMFTEFGGWPAISDEAGIAFRGSRYAQHEPTQTGIYRDTGGLLSVVADLNSVLPERDGVYTGFGNPGLDGPLLAFQARGRLFDTTEIEGVFAHDLGTGIPKTVADSRTTIPGTEKLFVDFFEPAVADGQVVFYGRKPDPDGYEGIYRWHAGTGTLEIVADEDDVAPGDEGYRLPFFDFTPAADAHNVAFQGTRVRDDPIELIDGLYTTLGLATTKVIDARWPLPDIFPDPDHTFLVMSSSQGALSGNRLVFRATDEVPFFGLASVILADDDFAFAGDEDGDGIVDAADNCVLAANPAQTDTDADGFGNACDTDIAPTPVTDCAINFVDLAALKAAFFASPGDPEWDADADFNGDGAINFTDLGIMKQAFFGPPGPSGLANACE